MALNPFRVPPHQERWRTSKPVDPRQASKHIVKGWQNTNPPFPAGCGRYFIVGTANTGKTFLAVRVIKNLCRNPAEPRQLLVIVSPNYLRDPRLQELAQWSAQQGLVVKVYQSFDKATLETFVQYMNHCALEGMRNIVYIDDPVGMGSFTSNVNIKSSFNSFVTGSKHYRSDIVFSTQAVGAMSASARKNIDVFIYLPDQISRDELYKSCRVVPTQHDFDRLMDVYATQEFNALWINVQFGRKGVYTINAAGAISPITSVP